MENYVVCRIRHRGLGLGMITLSLGTPLCYAQQATPPQGLGCTAGATLRREREPCTYDVEQEEVFCLQQPQ